jgi:hypothetical protein
MSHFTRMATRFTDVPGLVKALADVGFKNVEVHETPQHLYGFLGDQRTQTAEVIIRKKHVGFASNDIGFKRRNDGVFEAVVSSYDRTWYSTEWLNKLTQRYAYHVAKAKLEEQGFNLVTDEAKDGNLRLVLRRLA